MIVPSRLYQELWQEVPKAPVIILCLGGILETRTQNNGVGSGQPQNVFQQSLISDIGNRVLNTLAIEKNPITESGNSNLNVVLFQKYNQA